MVIQEGIIATLLLEKLDIFYNWGGGGRGAIVWSSNPLIGKINDFLKQ